MFSEDNARFRYNIEQLPEYVLIENHGPLIHTIIDITCYTGLWYYQELSGGKGQKLRTNVCNRSENSSWFNVIRQTWWNQDKENDTGLIHEQLGFTWIEPLETRLYNDLIIFSRTRFDLKFSEVIFHFCADDHETPRRWFEQVMSG